MSADRDQRDELAAALVVHVETRPSRLHLVHSGPARRCTCCLVWEDDNGGEVVDTITGLCLGCQPCPQCGLLGTACTDETCSTPTTAPTPWTPATAPRGPACDRRRPR